LCLNAIGLGIGITGTGWLIDRFRKAGEAEPYSMALLTFTVIAALAIPAFYFAGRWFKRDRAAIAEAEGGQV
jgi:MFS transporter, Spinster family, sphingosine-1-phosphate transporter